MKLKDILITTYLDFSNSKDKIEVFAKKHNITIGEALMVLRVGGNMAGVKDSENIGL